jgi:hypothetical protein
MHSKRGIDESVSDAAGETRRGVFNPPPPHDSQGWVFERGVRT